MPKTTSCSSARKFANSNQTSALDVLGFPNMGDQLTANTNWMEEIFNPATVVNHRLTATTKNSYLSVDYWDQTGVIGGEKSNYTRYSVRYNSSKKYKDFVTIGQNLNINRTDNNNIGTNSAFGGVQSDAFAYDPLTPVYDDAGAIRLRAVPMGTEGVHQSNQPLVADQRRRQI